MANTFKLNPIAVVAALLALLLIYLLLPSFDEDKGRRGGETRVVTEVVKQQPFAETVEGLGTSKANESVTITVQNTEIVSDILFDDGDKVKKGQLLIKLNAKEEQAKVNELNIHLQETKRQLNRLKDLAQQNATSAQLVDEQGAKVKATQAQLDVAMAKLSELRITAPFAGQLGIRQISKGALVKPGDSITTLDDLSIMKVDFSLSEFHLPSVKSGQKVEAKSVAYPDEIFEGKIGSIDSRVNPITRAIKVRALIKNPDAKLRPGMLITLLLEKKVTNSIVIPEKSLVPINHKQFVFIVDKESTAKQVEVVVGKRKPGQAQILSGLASGDQIVTQGTMRLRTGSKVNVVEQ